MTVAFATVLLGLLVGVQPVELEVGADVARVELRLDGELVGQRTGPPWVIPCDFGEDLAPHELVAIARDSLGNEMRRARQWVNLPPEPAGTGRPGGLRARTAVAVEVGKRGRDLDVQALADHLTVEGRPVEPAAVEKGPAEVVVVVDRGAWSGLRRMADLNPEALKPGRPITAVPIEPRTNPVYLQPGRWPGRRVLEGDESAAEANARRMAFLRATMRLEEGQLVRFLWPHSEEDGEDGEDREAEEGDDRIVHPASFRRSSAYPPSFGGMLWLLAVAHLPDLVAQEQRLADAVAAAGSVAAGSGRRAVVLVLGEQPSDASRLAPRTVRRYLEHLGVPLQVWAVGTVPDAVREAWGGVRPVPKKRALKRAVQQLSESLERQRIVWLEGGHLPQDVALTGATDDLRLVR
ncbi:MAG: hypothetical protein PVG07_16530 [Acidobacteriota bacterium]|jgi:hypothetical protein